MPAASPSIGTIARKSSLWLATRSKAVQPPIEQPIITGFSSPQTIWAKRWTYSACWLIVRCGSQSTG